MYIHLYRTIDKEVPWSEKGSPPNHTKSDCSCPSNVVAATIIPYSSNKPDSIARSSLSTKMLSSANR